MNPLNRAANIAQRRLDAGVYEHSLRVAFAVAQTGDVPTIVTALLCETVAAGVMTFEDMSTAFGLDVSRTVRALTREDGEDWRSYIERVRLDGTRAALVKRADLFDRLTGSACPPTANLRERLNIALEYLQHGDWNIARRAYRARSIPSGR